MSSNSNKSSFINAVKRMKKAILSTENEWLVSLALQYARQALVDAVDNYIESSGIEKQLTGNTVAGFSAGIYKDGTMVSFINALDVYPGMKGITSDYAYPGMSGFNDYGSGEYINRDNKKSPYVREYSQNKNPGLEFQETTPDSNAIKDTYEFLKKQMPRKGFVYIIIAECSPYVEYLHDKRNFDILDTLYFNVRGDLVRAANSTDSKSKRIDLSGIKFERKPYFPYSYHFGGNFFNDK